MQARQHRAQAGKGASTTGGPLAFQLSSPSKLVKRNVLDAPRPQALQSNPVGSCTGTAEDNGAVISKGRPKKSRWGPDQPSSSSPLLPAAIAKPWPPASGFKGVNSHRPPGALLSPRAAKQPDANALLQSDVTASQAAKQPDAIVPLQSEVIAQQAIGSLNEKEFISAPVNDAVASQHDRSYGVHSAEAACAHRSSPKHDRSDHTSASSQHTASGTGDCSRSPSREPSWPPSRERPRPPRSNGVMPRDPMRPPNRDNGIPKNHSRGLNRSTGDSQEAVGHDAAPNKRARQSNYERDYPDADRDWTDCRRGHNRGSADMGEADRRHSSKTVPEQGNYRRRDNKIHRRHDGAAGQHSGRTTSDPWAPRGASPANRLNRGRPIRHRSPSHEEEGQITDRPTTRSPGVGKDASELSGRQSGVAPGRLQSQLPWVPPLAPLPEQAGSVEGSPPKPFTPFAEPLAATAAAASDAAVNAQQLSLQWVPQSDQTLCQTADLLADPMSQSGHPLQLDPAAIRLAKPFAPPADALPLTTSPAAQAELPSTGSALSARPDLQVAAERAAGVDGVCAAGTLKASDVKGSAANEHNQTNSGRTTSCSPRAKATTSSPRNAQRSARDVRHSLKDRHVRESPSVRTTRCSPADTAHVQQSLHHSQKSRQSLEQQRSRQRFEGAPPSTVPAPHRHRSRTPDGQTARPTKRLRSDQWQPAMPSSHANAQSNHDRSRPAPQRRCRDGQLSMEEARTEAVRLPALPHQEDVTQSSQSGSPRSGWRASLPNGSRAHMQPPEDRLSSERQQSMLMSASPSPVHRMIPQPGGAYSPSNRARGNHSAPQPDDWQSDKGSDGHRYAVRVSDRPPPPRYNRSTSHHRSASQLDSMLDSSLSSDLRQNGSFGQSSQHSSGGHHPLRHDSLPPERHDRAAYTRRNHQRWSHDPDVPSQSSRRYDRGRSPHDMDTTTPLRAPHIATDLPGTDRHAHRSSPEVSHKDRHRRRGMSEAEQEAAAQARAHKLDWDMDQMMVKLLSAYSKPAEAIGNRQVLEAMRESVRVIGDIEDEACRAASPGFIATRQDLPGWLPDTKKQQVLDMLLPAPWLKQDPDFQPQVKLPVGWEPPECAASSLRPPAEPLDARLWEGLQQVPDLETSTVSVPFSREEAEAGEVGQHGSGDPRRPAPAPHPTQPLMLPMPLFPFLHQGEEATAESPSSSPEHSQGRAGGAAGPIDQLAPGGFLFDFWDMPHRPPSPAGSWSTSPHQLAASGWEGPWRHEPIGSGSERGPSAYLEPPAAPLHTTDTEQQYTDQVTTTAQPHADPSQVTTGQQQQNLFASQQQPHWQEQRQEEVLTPAASTGPALPHTPSASHLHRPASYPDPEPADYDIQFLDHISFHTWSLVILRGDMRQGKDVLPGQPVLNKAHGYWLPLQEGRWLPEHLHWAGIDQMLMQGTLLTPEAGGPADAVPDAAIEAWLTQTEDSCRLQLQSRMLLAQQTAIASPQPSHSATTASSQASGNLPEPSLMHSIAAPHPCGDTGAAPESLSDTQDWFDAFDVQTVDEEWVSMSQRSQSGSVADKLRQGRRCWGPPPPPQYPAMLCGELSLAVMTGVAGKSLVKEILDKAIQEELDKIKAT